MSDYSERETFVASDGFLPDLVELSLITPLWQTELMEEKMSENLGKAVNLLENIEDLLGGTVPRSHSLDDSRTRSLVSCGRGKWPAVAVAGWFVLWGLSDSLPKTTDSTRDTSLPYGVAVEIIVTVHQVSRPVHPLMTLFSARREPV